MVVSGSNLHTSKHRASTIITALGPALASSDAQQASHTIIIESANIPAGNDTAAAAAGVSMYNTSINSMSTFFSHPLTCSSTYHVHQFHSVE